MKKFEPLDASELEVKLFAQGPSLPSLGAFVPVFHQWIQTARMKPELLIDVADYAHVHHGPGVVLVGHEANYSLDQAQGRLGLAYRRKRPLAGDVASRLGGAFGSAMKACRFLEREPALEGLRFRTDEVRFRIQNRLLAPSGKVTFDSVKGPLESFLAWLYGGEERVDVHPVPPSKEPFAVQIQITRPPTITSLLSRLEGETIPRST